MKIAIIGGGASGLMSAYWASIGENKNEVTIFDGNEKIGKKVYITGKGRCNVTNNAERTEFFENVVTNPKFLYSAFSFFDNKKLIELLEENGLRLKVERGGRVFPVSDKSSDVIKTLEKMVTSAGARINLNEKIVAINKTENEFLIVSEKAKYTFDKVIIATGGKSYSATGSTGDGCHFAQYMGHTIMNSTPALVPMLLNDYERSLQGLSLKNVTLSAFSNDKLAKSLFGEMLFTENGISGPIVLSLSSYINRLDKISLKLDLKPALSNEQLENRVIREFDANKNKNIENVLTSLMPSTLIQTILKQSSIDSGTKINSITKEQRIKLCYVLKNLELYFGGLMPLDCAIITSGGVSTKEINPKTMESKLVEGLYFAGEVIDVDALTGGYNLQIAFSTGALAGFNASNN